MKRYVCGFMFTPDYKGVLLLLKRRGPDGMKGKFNGVGGEMNHAETPRQAIVREFLEETGMVTDEKDWTYFIAVRRCQEGEWRQTLFYYHSKPDVQEMEKSRSHETDEKPIWVEVNALPTGCYRTVYWLVPMAAQAQYEPDNNSTDQFQVFNKEFNHWK